MTAAFMAAIQRSAALPSYWVFLPGRMRNETTFLKCSLQLVALSGCPYFLQHGAALSQMAFATASGKAVCSTATAGAVAELAGRSGVALAIALGCNRVVAEGVVAEIRVLGAALVPTCSVFLQAYRETNAASTILSRRLMSQ